MKLTQYKLLKRYGNLNGGGGGGNIICSHGTNHSKGVAILFNPGRLDVIIESFQADKNGRYLLLEVYDF